METQSSQPGFVVTLNDRRSYVESDVRRLNALLIEHGEHAALLDDECVRLLDETLVRHGVITQSCVGLSIADMLSAEATNHYLRVELVCLMHSNAWRWLQLLTNHRDELIMDGFERSEAERYVVGAMHSPRLQVKNYRQLAQSLGVSLQVDVYKV